MVEIDVSQPRRGKSSPGAGFVAMDGDTFLLLLAEAGYIKPSDALEATR